MLDLFAETCLDTALRLVKLSPLLLQPVQVASVKPSGERIQMTLPLTSMPDEDQLRDPEDYMFEIQPTEESDMHESSLLVRAELLAELASFQHACSPAGLRCCE